MGLKYVLEFATAKYVRRPVDWVDHGISRLYCCVNGLATLSSHNIGI